MDSIYQTSLLAPPNDIDFSNRMKVSALFDLIQSAASAHAEQLHLGYEDLKNAGLFWVLSWARIEIDRVPQYRDPIRITTWPHGRHRLFSIRDFLFCDDQEQVFCRARTAWLLLDARLKRITTFDRLPRPVPYLGDRRALEALPEKLLPLDGAEQVLQKRIGYIDLDLNQHVNNARYVELLLDSYPLEFHASHQVCALTISFQNESKYGDVLVIARKIDREPAGRHQVAARLVDEEKGIFRAVVDWKPRDC